MRLAPAARKWFRRVTLFRVSKRGCRVQPGEVSCVRCLRLQSPCSLSERAGICPPWMTLGQPAPRQEHQEILPSIRQRQLETSSSDPEFPATPARSDSRDLNEGFCQEAVRNYFRVIHDKHHSLFHQPTFEVNRQEGLVPEVIVSAMIALGARCEIPFCISNSLLI